MFKKLFFIIACAAMVSTTILLPSYAIVVIKSKNDSTNVQKSNEKIATSALGNAINNAIRNTVNEAEASLHCARNYSGSDVDRCKSCYSHINTFDSCMQNNRSDGNNSSTGNSSSGSSSSSSSSSSSAGSQTSGGASSGVTNSDDADHQSSNETAHNNYAAVVPNTSAFEGREDASFLGFVSWDNGVNIKDEESLKAGIWQIAVNIAIDITVAATYLVLGYVIYGGYLYTFSSGEASKVEEGKKTLTRAFIGLAIVLLANLIMNTIRFALLGANGQLTNCATANCVNPVNMVSNAINWFIGIAGAVSLIFVVYGGILYITSSGEAGKLEKAKKTITYALIGLIIVALSIVITSFVTSIIKGQPTAFISDQTIISKQ